MTPEQILKRAIGGIPVYAIFVFDGNGVAHSWNEGVRHVLGYEREEFIGMDADLIFIPEDLQRGAPEQERQQAREKGTVADFRWHRRKDGTRFWANGNVHHVVDEDGREAGFVKIMRDATREKRLQTALEDSRANLEKLVEERTRELSESYEQLQRSERRFKEVFRTAPIAMLLTDKEDVIIDANEAFESLTGFMREEALGRNAKRLGLWNSPEDRQKLRDSEAEERGFRALELQIYTKDGQRRDILSSAAIVDIDSQEGLVKMFVDITHRKQTEAQLMQALQEVLKDTSSLARSVMEKLAHARGEPNLGGPELSDLTRRELQVLALIAQGKSNEQIGQELGLASPTVRNYVTNVYAKIQVGSRGEAIVWARERGLGGH